MRQPTEPGTPVLRAAGLDKSFPGVRALRGARLEVLAGEVHALVGENGAGKSTLARTVAGAETPDAGTVEIAGVPLSPFAPARARRLGVAAIHQEPSLVPGLTVRENLFLGKELSRGGFTLAAGERARARDVLSRLGADVDPEARAGDLDLARQQLVEIARALLDDARLLLLDEPTAALSHAETRRLFKVVRALAARGTGTVFVSHRLDEIFEIAARVTVMRDGETLGTWGAGDLTRERLVELMVGRPLDREFPKIRAEVRGEALSVRGLRGGRVRDVSFSVRRGEVLGIAGLAGSGRTDVARLIFGADRIEGGEIRVGGRVVAIRSPRDAIRHGIALLTEDRKAQGLFPGLSARENFALPGLARWSRLGWIARRREGTAFSRWVGSLSIRLASPEQPVRNLSGGNQQKLLVARWLESDASILIFDEPTRGVDVGAKREIHLLVNDLAARGKAVVMISSELPEILGMSDRILVLRDGRIRGEIESPERSSQEEILSMAVS